MYNRGTRFALETDAISRCYQRSSSISMITLPDTSVPAYSIFVDCGEGLTPFLQGLVPGKECLTGNG